MATWAEYQQTMIEAPTLWAAARRDDVLELATLLDGGADIDARDARGYSALMLAGYLGHAASFELLLARGADPDTRDLGGSSVLMGVAFKGHLALVERLLAAGADPTRKNHAGLDARAFAEMFGRLDVVARLDALARSTAAAAAAAASSPEALISPESPLHHGGTE